MNTSIKLKMKVTFPLELPVLVELDRSNCPPHGQPIQLKLDDSSMTALRDKLKAALTGFGEYEIALETE